MNGFPASIFLCTFKVVICRRISSEPTPTPWPDRFHALLYMNLSKGDLQMSDLWYDWPRGRNVNVFQKQLGAVLYDVEWNNGTSFYFTAGARDGEGCRVEEFGVGIPRPDFMLDGDVRYLGTVTTDGGFRCHVWEKAEFIWYYEDIVSGRPVRWDFYDGISSHVMTFEEDAVLDDSITQAPSYCFHQDLKLELHKHDHHHHGSYGAVNPLRRNLGPRSTSSA